MANNTNEHDEMNEPEIESTEAAESAKSSKHIHNYLITGLSFIVAVSAVLIAIYSMQLHNQLQQSMLDSDGSLAKRLTQLNDIQSQTQSQLSSKNADFQQLQTEIDAKITSLQKQLQSAMTQQMYQNQDWLLLKARYTLELAELNNFWSTDYKSTIALLQNADDLLKQNNEPKVLAIRQAIAKEIGLINATPKLDITGLISQLDALQLSISKLQMSMPNEKSSAQEQKNDEQESSSWRNRMHDSAQLFGKLVVIRRNNEQIKPLMSPLYESILKESISLRLQEAQWAVLNNNSEVYQAALNQSVAQLKLHFADNKQSMTDLLEQLQSLQEIKLVASKPAIGEALTLLNQLIDRKEAQGKSKHNVTEGK